jgi:hypothetical protein
MEATETALQTQAQAEEPVALLPLEHKAQTAEQQLVLVIQAYQETQELEAQEELQKEMETLELTMAVVVAEQKIMTTMTDLAAVEPQATHPSMNRPLYFYFA